MIERNIGHVGGQERLLKGNGIFTEIEVIVSKQRIRKNYLRQMEDLLWKC